MPEPPRTDISLKEKLCLYCKRILQVPRSDQWVHDDCQEALYKHNLVVYNNILVHKDDARVLLDLELYGGKPLPCADNTDNRYFEYSQQYNIDALYYTGVGFRTENWHIVGLNLWNCIGGPNYRGKVGSHLVLKALYESLPESLKDLHYLQYLDLARDLFTDLPECIGELQSLQILYLTSNKLSSLPDSICNLQNLRQLYLGMNKFTSFPDIVCQLSRLERLAVNNNAIVSLPENIDKLQNLEFLWLNSNHIATIPENLGNLSHLKLLWLQNNQLTTLPESLGNLYELRYLGLEGNSIRRLPYSFAQLIKLERLGKGNWHYYVRNPDWSE